MIFALVTRYALPVALTVAVVMLGVQSLRLSAERQSHAETRADHSQQLTQMAETARQAEAQARAEEHRRSQAHQEIIDDAQRQTAQARADADAAADAGRRLRQHIATITARCRAASQDTGTASGGAAADATERVLADVQRRLDEAAERTARFADDAYSAGRACERAYDALIP